ncbi:Gfo/Idh/MocA family protein [Roseobacter litoralis]|uniref:Oxidoreductase-like protein n=1 Tax=Roseobacter litoralis (strain ATCC 49566 / DSM 6996 / JCM 21268 / NBRC 15278 / OCh 149) TaxID=391595 RepID=F7ZJ62_ROSLO|nr:Gfo/Idh/MocA family oxidoreductase [Roseobacter litoralis]AEI96307.1 oxidoreductase-like protein [Roseobacter litoralis Och 149]
MAKTFGVVGLGRMGYRTVLAGRAAGLDLAAVLDTAENPWGVTQDPSLAHTLVDTLDTFLARTPDVVAISTTADSHAPLFQAIAKAGIKTVLMEKPVACSVSQGLEMTCIAQEQDIHVMVNHNHRCWSVLKSIRALDGDTRFGRLKSFVIVQGAGGLGNLGTHYFDLSNWMFRCTPDSVAAIGTEPEAINPRGERFEDKGGAVLVSYPDQRRLLLEIGDDIGVIGGYEFRFERGRVLMPFTSDPPKAYVRKAETQALPKHFYGAALEEVPLADFVPGDVVKHTSDVFKDLSAGEHGNGATLSEATAALEVMIAARLAIERCAVVHLPLTSADRETTYTLA